MTKKQGILLILVGITIGATTHGYGQTEKSVESAINDITIFLSRAQVSRTVKTRLEPGKTNLVVTGLASNLDPNSIQVSGKGSFVILGTTHRQNFLQETSVPKAMRVLRDSLEQYQGLLSLEQSRREIVNKEEAMLMANQKVGGSNQNLTVTELKAMADFYRSRLGDIVTTRMKQENTIKMLNHKIARLQAQINSQNELLKRNTSEIVISLSADGSTTADLEVNYVVSQAGWHPVYDVRVVNTKEPVRLSYKANVFQSTGEDWKNVRLKLSTANPNLSGLKPELTTQYLDFYQPIVYQDKRRNYKSSAPMAAGKADEEVTLNEEVSAESLADMVTTVQTSVNTEFVISVPYTVPSSNKPTLVDIRNHEMKASFQYSVTPKQDVDAFLMARTTGWEDFSLLPGPANIFFEGTFVGKTFIDPNSIKDTLTVSLGRDKRIVVQREKVKDFTTRKAIGTSIREAYAYELSVRNTRQESITIVIEDQVPVSQNSQIEVMVTDTAGATWNKETGKLSWTWTLQPSETKKTVFKFEVKYPKDKQISGL